MMSVEEVQHDPPKPVDLAALPAFMQRLYGGELPIGVVDELIAERRQEARRERVPSARVTR